MLWKFATVFVNDRGEVIETRACQAHYFEEFLAEGVPPLVMVEIPAGEFVMGSPSIPKEKDRHSDEGPQHPVKVQPFFMGQTPITQAQWRVVAAMEQVGQEITPNPSEFKGDDYPVEQVNWYDAIEFCARLSRYTGKDYRLPSEAEWEYACRAVSVNSDRLSVTPVHLLVSPFHFGKTITTELANYNSSVYTYRNEPDGNSLGQTSPVRSFPPNAFGLYDMHGNVWEWCADPWHGNYHNAPVDSRVWDGNNDSRYHKIADNIEVLLSGGDRRVLRGGSWDTYVMSCRSASRSKIFADYRFSYGFRVACGAASTL